MNKIYFFAGLTPSYTYNGLLLTPGVIEIEISVKIGTYFAIYSTMCTANDNLVCKTPKKSDAANS